MGIAAGRIAHGRVLAASIVGSTIEWFDYFLYGTLAALVFSKAFFPSTDPAASLMLAYLSFALSFFIRPLGGVLFSHLGDRVGRKQTLVITLALMGGATMAIGLLPTYEQIGIAAPALLVLLRLIQGIGISGEWGGALLLAYEHAPSNRKGLFGSLPQIGVTLGMLLSTASVTLVSLLPEADFQAWGWRLPFLASVTLVLVGLWIRRGVAESPEFLEMKATQSQARSPLIQTLRGHWPAVLTAVFAKFVETAPFYVFTVFVVSYATGVLNVDRLTVLNAVTAGALLATIAIPIAGWASDFLGRRTVFLAGCAALAIFAIPYFLILSAASPASVFAATAIAMGLVWPLVTSVLGTLFSEIFSTDVRYTGVTLGYQIGAALAGGTAPLVATWLLTRAGGHWAQVAGYLIGTAVLSAGAIVFGYRRFRSAAALERDAALALH